VQHCLAEEQLRIVGIERQTLGADDVRLIWTVRSSDLTPG
jgi:hypothetical protein